MSIEKVVVIIPTYNEALVIEKTIKEVFAAVAASAYEVHILVFDSCSNDDTQAIVSRMQQHNNALHLLTEQQKTGLGSAYLQAMNHALSQLQADIVVEFDADLSHQPCYLIPILEQMRTHDVVIGSRYVRGGSIPNNWGLRRKLLSKMGNAVSRLILTAKYKDFTSGFRATHYLALRKALPQQFISNNYAYKIELLWNLHRLKTKILEYPIAFVDREAGCSKLPTNTIIDSLKVLFTLRFNALKPYLHMCFVGLLGLIVQGIVYNLLRFYFTPFVSIQMAIIVAMLNNFTLNNYFTFNKRQLNQPAKSLAFFIGFSALMVVFQSNWVRLGVEYLGTGYLKENIIIASGVALGSVLNYFIYSRIIWRKKKLQTH